MTEKQETSAHLDAQLGVIGSLLLDADKCAGEVFLRTREEQYTGEYKTLFAAAKRLYQEGRPIDPVTVRGIAGEEYTNLILQIMELTPTAANCGAYLDLLVEQAQVSKMQTLGLALASCKSTEEAKHLIEEANQVIVQRAALRVVSAEQGHLEFLLRQDEKVSYIPWGFPKLDETVLSTLGDLVILGGRPSAGKTALSLQMAWEQAKTQKVGYFSFETNPDEVYDRLHALAASVDSVKIRKRTLGKDEIARVIQSRKEFTTRSIDVIHASEMSVADVRSVTVARGYQVVYVDYLQIINPEHRTRQGDRFRDVTQISMDLHRMAVSLGVRGEALSQLSRPDRSARSKVPDLYSLRESGQIEQDADAVFLLYLNEEAIEDAPRGSPPPTPPRTLRVAKNKKGFSGGYIELDFDGATQTFHALSPKSTVQRDLVDAGKAAKQKNRCSTQGKVVSFQEITGDDPDLPF